MTLHEITQEILINQDAIDGAVSRLHGEHPEMAKEDLLRLLLPDFKKKILGYARVAKNLSAEEAELSAEHNERERHCNRGEIIERFGNKIVVGEGEIYARLHYAPADEHECEAY